MQSKGSMASRHPKIIMITDSLDETSVVSNMISEQVDAFRTFTLDKAKIAIKDAKPYIIVFALSSLEKNTDCYIELYEKELIDYQHDRIVLCDNRQSGAAFLACVKNIFTDYFVYKPMYEHFRLRMLLHRILQSRVKELGDSRLKDEHFGKVDDELKLLINQVAEVTQSTSDSLNEVKDEMTSFNSKIIEEVLSQEKIQQLFDEFKKERIFPMLESLNRKVGSEMSSVAKTIESQQQSINAFNNASTKNDIPEIKKVEVTEQNLPPVTYEGNDSVHQIRILLVEDNEIYRALISNILADEKFCIDSAADAREALKKINNNKYDLIFMDLFLPESNGMALTKHIREKSPNEKTPIIALTTNRKKEVAKKWASHGLSGYIVKPSSAKEVIDKVYEVLTTDTS